MTTFEYQDHSGEWHELSGTRITDAAVEAAQKMATFTVDDFLQESSSAWVARHGVEFDGFDMAILLRTHSGVLIVGVDVIDSGRGDALPWSPLGRARFRATTEVLLEAQSLDELEEAVA